MRHSRIQKVVVIILKTNLPIKHFIVIEIEFNMHAFLYIAGNIAGYSLNNLPN